MSVAASVPFFSPAGAAFGVDLAACLRQVVDSGWYVLGSQVRDFEAAFADYVGVSHTVGVANGTDALVLALRALGVGAGSRVAMVANAGYYGSAAAALVGAEPMYVDVDAATLTMEPGSLSAVLAHEKTDAVIVTHLYGQMADMDRLSTLCRQAGVPLIEDGAQAHGAAWAGRQAGAWGAVGCFSFYPTKNLGALGDGGAVVTGDAELADRLRALRQYGWGRKYEVLFPGGGNSRLDELQAAVLLAKLPRLDAANAERRAIAGRYGAQLAGLPLTLPPPPGEGSVAHLYVIRTPRRQALQARLVALGIGCDVHYPVPDHLQPVRQGRGGFHLPVTEAACAQVLSLPCYPGLQPAQQDRVIAAVHDFFAEAGTC